MNKEGILDKISKLEKDIIICVSKREKYNEIMKSCKVNIKRLRNEIRNKELREDIENEAKLIRQTNIHSNVDYISIFRKLSRKYDLTGGTIQRIYYTGKS